MKNSKLFTFVCFACIVCLFMLYSCENTGIHDGQTQPPTNTTENVLAGTDDIADKVASLPDGTKELLLYAYEGVANAVLTVKDGKFTSTDIKTADGSVIVALTAEYAEAGADYYAKLECALNADVAPIPEVTKAILKINDKCDIISEAYYAADGSLIAEFAFENEYANDGVLLKTVIYMNGTKMMEAEFALSASGELYNKRVISYYDGGYSVQELDEKGNCLRYLTYENGVLVVRQEYTYDESGELLLICNYSGDKMTFRRTYEYEGERTYITHEVFTEDKIILEKMTGEVECYKARYRLDGSLIEEYLYKEDPNRTKTVNGKEAPYFYLDRVVDYDESGKKTEEVFYYYKDFKAEDGSTVSNQHYHITYRYDENGNITNEHKYENVYDSNGVLVLVNQYNNGELTLLQVFGEDGQMQFANRYSGREVTEQEIYEYDENGKRQVKEKRYNNFLEIPKVD